MNLKKTLSLTTLSTLTKVVAQFIINKFIAIYLGPNGLAIIGQLQNFIQFTTNCSSGFINEGVIKYTAEKKETSRETSLFHSTAFWIILLFSSITSLLIFFNSTYLAQLIFKSPNKYFVFKLLSFTTFFLSFNLFFTSVLNGYKKIKKLVFINITSSLISLVFLSIAITQFSLNKVLCVIALIHVFIFLFIILFIYKEPWFKLKHFTLSPSKKILKKYSHFIAISLVGLTATPLSLIFIREYIGNTISWDASGQWHGIWTLSSTYIILITSSLSMYYLPRLSEIKKPHELKSEIIQGYKIILPITIASSYLVFLFREPIVYIAFSPRFEAMIPLFKWQLIGNFFKVSSLLLSYLMLAKAMTKTFIVTEILSHSLFILFSIIFIDQFGLIGVTYAFCLNYFIYFITMVFIFKNKI